jgi:hypothetical protein
MELKLDSVTDFITGQEWFQKLKGKWEELDPQSKSYLKIAATATGTLLFLYLIFGSLWGIHKLKKELAEKSDLLLMIHNANDEMHRLHENGSIAPDQAPPGPWNAYFETIATSSGIDKSILTLSPEKTGPTADIAKESIFDLSLKKTTIRQIVKFAYFLENGTRPVKLRGISVDTGADPTGYMDATLSVSAFTLIDDKNATPAKGSK